MIWTRLNRRWWRLPGCRKHFLKRIPSPYYRCVFVQSYCWSNDAVLGHFPLKKSYLHWSSDVPFLGCTVGEQLDETAAKFPERDAVVFSHQGIRRNFHQLVNDVDDFAAGLVSLGVEKGDRVGIWAPNDYEWVVTYIATARIGVVLAAVNPGYKVHELEYCIQKVGLKALVAANSFKTQDYYAMLCEAEPAIRTSKPGLLASKKFPNLKHIIMYPGSSDHNGTYTFNEVMNMGTSEHLNTVKTISSKLQFDEPINIQFTSGTTGHPKGATLTHHQIINNCYFGGRRLGYHKQPPRLCLPLPLYHCFGSVLGMLSTVVFGATTIYPAPSFSAEEALKSIQDERASSLYGTPTMFIDMVHHPNFAQYDLSSLTAGLISGAPVPVELCKSLMEKMQMPDLQICMGTTENSPLIFNNSIHDSLEKRLTTIGRPIAHIEVKVVDNENRVVPVNTPGELCTRGYMVMRGYWGDSEKTAEVYGEDRWFHTGDVATLDEDGFARIVGRMKDMVIRGGENISPNEIENFLHTHPNIQDAYIVGVPDERMGEELFAWLRLKPSSQLTEDEVKAFCKGQISHFKIPKYIKFVEEFPMTVTGKVQKFKLRELAASSLGLEK